MSEHPTTNLAVPYADGFATGVQAARDAVEAVWTEPDGVWIPKSNALAAIDALTRGKGSR